MQPFLNLRLIAFVPIGLLQTICNPRNLSSIVADASNRQARMYFTNLHAESVHKVEVMSVQKIIVVIEL